jgi:hypothetical protein
VLPELDLLVIDIDGNDYWVWYALCASGRENPLHVSPEPIPFTLETNLPPFRPRVVCIEYNARWAPPDDRFVQYKKEALSKFSETEYFSASITAYARLGRLLGYKLVYAENAGVNLFFVREDVAVGYSFEDSIEKLYRRPMYNGGKGWLGPVPRGYHWLTFPRKSIF